MPTPGSRSDRVKTSCSMAGTGLHVVPVADVLRHVRVLAEEQQILDHQAQDDAGDGDARQQRRARRAATSAA